MTAAYERARADRLRAMAEIADRKAKEIERQERHRRTARLVAHLEAMRLGVDSAASQCRAAAEGIAALAKALRRVWLRRIVGRRRQTMPRFRWGALGRLCP